MLTSGFGFHRRGLRRVGLTVAACLLLLVTTGHAISFHLETNLENLAFLNTLCGQGADCRSPLLPDGRFNAPDPLPDVWQHNDNLTACQALWLSRLQASTSLEAAQAKLVEAQDCNRHNLVTVWRGDLAWTGGQQEAARREWANLSGSQLTERSYWLMLQGDIERSRAMLQVALNEEDPDIPPTEVKRLHVVLGHS